MLFDMAPGSEAPASFQRRCRTTAALLLIVCVTLTNSAPTAYDEIEAKHTDLAAYLNDPNGCYYNYQHYEEGDRIVTNEPCLNCTCHNRMLMCYLRVCPFSKAIGQDCTVQKSPDQCCPTISCPEVPVHLLTSSTTQKPTTTTEIGWHDNYGCVMNEDGFFPDGAQVPPDPKKPCELCYCIRNRTACVMQECTLHVEGCRPVYEDGVCCPVRYDCDYENEKSTTSVPQINGGLVFSTTSAPFDCRVNDDVYRDGESIAMVSDKPCEHCYCMRGDIVCAVQDCGEPLRGKDCTPETPPTGQCCPTSYQCANETISSDDTTTLQPVSQSDSDENEAEKYPLNENAYNKLGEHQPNQQDDTNDVNSDTVYTTQANINELTDSDQTTNKNEDVHNTAPNSHNVLDESNTLLTSNGANIINNLETLSTKPESTDHVNATDTESTILDEVEPTKPPSSDPTLNENAVNPTTQTPSDNNINVKITEENKGNESPSKNPIQNDLTPNVPVSSTENSIESETQSSNLQDKPQNEILTQTDSPTIIEKEHTKFSNNDQVPEQFSDDKSQIVTTPDVSQNPPKQSNEESTESYTGENKIPIVNSQNKDSEQTTQKLNQNETEKTPLEETVEQGTLNKNSEDTTQTSQVNDFQTEIPSTVEQKLPKDKPQEENIQSTEIPKVGDVSVQQGNMPVENKPLTDKLPELEKNPSEQNQDSPQEENVTLPTEVPEIENEPTEQNKLPAENKPQIESQSELEKTPTEQNQNSTQENVSSTEVPKIENTNGQQEENISQTDIPKEENEPTKQNEPAEENVSQIENESSANIHKVGSEPVGQNTPVVESNSQTETQPESQTPTEQNEYSAQDENESSSEISNTENEPVEQNKPLAESNLPTNNQPATEKTPTEQINQDSPQSENESSTEIPKVENGPTQQNTPLEENSAATEITPQTNKTPVEQNNQDSLQTENVSPTSMPKVENEPTQQNTPLEENNNVATEIIPQTNKIPVEQNNQDSVQSENLSPTNIPEVENEPNAQNKPLEENNPQTQNQPESQTTPIEKNQDIPQVENGSSTEIPEIENKPSEQNTPLVHDDQHAENQPESQTSPTEQDKSQIGNGSSTEIPKKENKPINQNVPENEPESQKTPIEQNQGAPQIENVSSTTDSLKVEDSSMTQAENQPQIQQKPVEPNQDSAQVENVPQAEIPSKLNESPTVNVVSENDVPTEQPVEDNNIFIVSPTSPPLFSQNQIKNEEHTSTSDQNNNNDKFSSTEKNEVEKPQTSSDEKPTPSLNTNANDASISSTEIAPDTNNASPQTNDESIEHLTETKPIEIENNDMTSNPVNSHEPTLVSDEHNDNRFGPNNAVSSEPAFIPTTETNKDANSGLISQGVLVDNSTKGNQPENENQNFPSLNSLEHQNAPQTETPVEIEASTNKNSYSSDDQVNDVTTTIPQQIADKNIPVQPVIQDSSAPIKNQEETKIPSNSNVLPETNGNQNFDETSKATESPVLFTNTDKQSVTTPILEQHQNESITPLIQEQDENLNEVVEHTSVYPDISSSDKNSLNTATGLSQNNEENSTPLSDKIETSTNIQDTSDSSIKDIHKDTLGTVTVPTIEQINQDNLGNSENTNSDENVVTTNNYVEEPSVFPTTNSPVILTDKNEENLPINPSNNVKPSISDLLTNVAPQQSVGSDEISTQYNVDDSSTNNPIQDTPIVSVDNNVKTNTNGLSDLGNLNEVSHDSSTENEIFATHSPTEKNVLSVNSNKTPANDATMEVITKLPEKTNVSEIIANEVANGNPLESSQITKEPENKISMTTISYNESPSTPESIETDQINPIGEITTSSAEKYNDETTELYENVQPGVPGEGSCLIDFVTYAHKAEVPKSNPCHEKCECLNSIVTCTSVNCPPAPPQHRNCIPLHPGNESWCCPTYICDGSIEGMVFQNAIQHHGSPQLISTVVLEDKPNEENDQNTPIYDEILSTSSPQSGLEYNTLAPVQTDSSSDKNLQNNGVDTGVPAQTEIPNHKIGDSTAINGVTDAPVTTTTFETVENEKPSISDQSSENEKLGGDQASNVKNPAENENLGENNKPVESDQTADNEKPINDSESDVTTVSYVANVQTETNRPETSSNIEEQNTLLNTANESQDYPAPTTESPNYETTVTNILQANVQNQPQQNSEPDNTQTVATVKPNESDVDQQVDGNKTEEGVETQTANGESDTKPAVDGTDLPLSPIEVTQTPTIVADEKPSTIDNNADGLRPSNVDDIISSVNMVKDVVKNSLETSSKPTEIDYQTTYGAIDNNRPTVLPEESTSPSSENSLPDKISESQPTISNANIASEFPMNINNEKLPESPAATESHNDSGATQIPIILPSVNPDQVVSTDLPLFVPDKQEIPTTQILSNADVITNRPEETVDDKVPEVTTQNLQNTAELDLTSNEPNTANDSILPQSNIESNTNVPEAVGNNKVPDTTTQATQQEVLTNDVANKPVDQEKPVTKSPILSSSDVDNADKAPVEVSTQATVSQSSSGEAATDGVSTDDDKRFGAPSSSTAPSEPTVQEDDNINPPEFGNKVQIPFVTDDSSSKPSSNTPIAPQKQPSYTPIPQSTWTQKPFHHDTTSEAPVQPDQGSPDEYDDENEAVYGPGTCRYGGKVYVSAQQVPRDDPCDFCFCFRGDIICLQQSCPPPIFGCYQEDIQGFCCPRYECPVAQATSVNVTTTTTTTTTMVPPHFFANAYRGAARRAGCLIHGHAYRVGEDVGIASGPCLECICGADGKMKCDPKSCHPEPLLRKMMAEAVYQRR